ncbi:hypothetical protein V8C37DRAFT_366504 [Trichoderma ceciliae]
MSRDDGRSMEEAITAGRARYVAQRYKQALDSFTDAIKLCPCEMEKKKRKRSASISQELGETTPSNQSATSLPTLECRNPLHLQALNCRAGTFEKTTDFDRAQADARRMMDIAPCSPEGYLRASKILRMKEDPANALNILTDGILEFFERGDFQIEDIRRLDKARKPLKSKFGKVDPLGGFVSLSWMSKAHLPAELVRDIFGQLELSTLCQCLRVSKTWRKILTAPGSGQLWRSLIFTGASVPNKYLSFDTMKKLLAHSLNDVRELVIDNALKFGLDQRKFNVVLGAGLKLERLELANPCEALILTRVPKNLKHLRLEGFYRFYRPSHAGRDAYEYFLLAVVGTLESLTLAGLPRQWLTDMAVPIMPNLRHLKLVRGQEQPWSLSVLQLLRNTPQLEQLYLEDLLVDCRLPDDEPFDNCCVPNLKSLTIIDTRPRVHERDADFWVGNHNEHAVEAYQHLTALNLGHKLKALEIRYTWEYTSRNQGNTDIFGGMYRERAYEYEDLEMLRLSNMVMSPEIAQRLFQSSIRAGKLHTFDIVFPLPTLSEKQGQSSANHIQKYQWLQGAESIRCIGLYEFNFKAYLYASENPLIQFLQKLPCLEELRLASAISLDYEFVLIVEDVLNSVKLKSIYTTQISGSAFDKVRRLARSKGVKFVWEKQPTTWPIDLEDN